MQVLRERFGVSERRACRVVGQHRSTQRLDPPVIDDDEQRLREFLRDFARRRPRWGWRRAAKDARRVGWQVNDKRVRRLWRDEGLKVPYKGRKQRLIGVGAHVGAMCPIRPNALWAMDFQFDVTIDGRTLKLLNVIDEFTRECPAIVVDRSIDADAVVALLDRLATERGAPGFVRFDNGPEFIAHAVADWYRFNDVNTVFINPGSPWQNAWIESFNGRPATSCSTAGSSTASSRPGGAPREWPIGADRSEGVGARPLAPTPSGGPMERRHHVVGGSTWREVCQAGDSSVPSRASVSLAAADPSPFASSATAISCSV